MIAILLSMGLEEIRQKGSHKFFAHSDGRTTVIPDHTGEDLGRPAARCNRRHHGLPGKAAAELHHERQRRHAALLSMDRGAGI